MRETTKIILDKASKKAYEEQIKLTEKHIYATILSYSLNRWNRKKDNAPEIIHAHAIALELWQEANKTKGIDLPFDAKLFREIIVETFDRRLDNFQEQSRLGNIINALILFGCSRKQAIEALAEWRGCSETLVRTAHENFRIDFQESAKQDTIIELSSCWETFTNFLKETENEAFPRSPLAYKKAEQSYKLMKTVFSDQYLADFKENISKAENYFQFYKRLSLLAPIILTHGHFEFLPHEDF